MYEIISLISISVLSPLFYFLFKKNRIVLSNSLPLLSVKTIIFLAGILLIYFNIVKFNDYLGKKSWPMVKGEIVDFKIVGIKTREPDISYRFLVNGTFFVGHTNLHTPFFGSSKSQEQTARAISGNYQVGDSVMVYYNAVNPQQSALKIRPLWSTYIQFTFGILIVSGMLALILVPLKSKEDQK